MLKAALLAAAALACGAALFTVQAALAHSRPVRFDPAPGSVLQSAPSRVDGWFTNELRRDPNWSFIHVADAQGNRVDSGDPVLSADRRQMTATLKSGLGPGLYTVTWRTWDDSDGAIFGDCYTFFVGPQAAETAVSSKTRLDGGGDCARFEFDAEKGTPTPNQLAKALATAVEEATSSSGGRVPWWTLVAGIAGGLAVGGVGVRFLSSRR